MNNDDAVILWSARAESFNEIDTGRQAFNIYMVPASSNKHYPFQLHVEDLDQSGSRNRPIEIDEKNYQSTRILIVLCHRHCNSAMKKGGIAASIILSGLYRSVSKE